MKKGFMPLIAILVVALLLTGFTGKKEQDPKASLEGRIKLLEAEIVELRSLLRKNPGMKLGVIQDDPGPELEPRVFLDGTRGWIEDGVNMWTAMGYNVGINTVFAPAFDLDINGNMNIAGGINDGASFGLANDVLVSDGLGGVEWGASPGGVAAYIWNQDTAAQTPANFWISGTGRADYSLIGISSVVDDFGVFGWCSAASGTGQGIWGEAGSDVGFGGSFVGGNAGTWWRITGEDAGVTSTGLAYGIMGWGHDNTGGGEGIGVLGVGNPQAAATVRMAYGTGVRGYSPTDHGVYGATDSDVSFGVYGYNAAIGGDGVFGVGNAPAAASYWGGAGVSGSSDDVGIFAHGSAASSHGLVAVGNGVGAWTIGGGAGAAITSSNIGVYARGDDTADSWGIYARSSGSNGVGAFAVSNSNPSYALVGVSAGAGWHTITGEDCGLTANGLWCGGMGWGDDAGTGRGLVGIGDATNLPLGIVTANGSGVCGFSSDGTGVFGCSDNNVGVWGYNFNTSYACIQGGSSALNTSGLLAICNTGSRAAETVGGDNLALGEYSVGIFNTPIGNGDYNGLYVGANVVAWGYWTHLKSGKGKDISAAAVLSPDANVVISGTSELRDGKGSVTFDETFKELISSDIPVNVIATPTEECNGVYVSNVSKNGFSVNELMSGKSTASFNWIAIGRREGCEERRVYAEKTLKSKIASKETVARIATTVNSVTKKENEVKESKIKRVTPQEEKGINFQKGSLKSKDLKKKKAFE